MDFNSPRYYFHRGGFTVAELTSPVALSDEEVWQVGNLMSTLWGDRVEANNLPLYVTGAVMDEIEEPEE